ncbi:uncharacterized protein EAE97_009456 [Botrytis byssoidea]|uniref:Uncharacterized protein n=2 Tax=Sclerotiniaceae TaxID=28983 RepID=A0A4Z1IAZ1_9HELO|nr:uncharacterized protein EAE97_009456 [Botrytis byssoidea]KAF7929859.1 hypothetical protein EAE97_009456 [Botrytis byssoidea]TGO57794.1 hypothetical protein BOTNAR_0194g00160 [Botryotinia narcissicola]
MQSITRTLSRQSRLFTPQLHIQASRPFSSTFISRKSATEAVKETVHKVDKAVASKIVDGIEVGQTATQKAKEAAGLSASEAKTAASNAASEAQGTTSSATGSASGTASELAGQAKGKAAELKGAAKGKAAEVKGEVKGKL